jgi:cytochrome c-type biogenesis protein CcmH
MMLFAFIASGMTLLALVFVLPALLRKPNEIKSPAADEMNALVLTDQLRELENDRATGTLDSNSYASARRELEQRMAGQGQRIVVPAAPKQNWLATSVLVTVPVVALILYLMLGSSTALDPKQLVPQQQEISQDQILGMVQKLADRLKQQPGDAQGWSMLARSYFELHRFHDATDAYAHLNQLVPDNADYLASYALTMALDLNKNLQGEPEKILQRALKLDPKNIRALSLLGSAAFDRRDYALATTYWKRVLPLVLPESAISKSTQNSIDEAEALLTESTKVPIVKMTN